MTLGDRLKSLRIDAGLTQEQLAQRIGVKKQNISRYENGRVEPNIRTAKRIAEALGVTLEDIASSVSSVASLSLTPDEIQLLVDYRSLDKEGREYIRHTMVLTKQGHSEKNEDLSMLENA